MKKFLLLLVCLVLAIICPVLAAAETAPAADSPELPAQRTDTLIISEDRLFVCFLLTDGTAEFVCYLGDETELVVPSEISGYTHSAKGSMKQTSSELNSYTVTAVGEWEGSNYPQTSLVLPDTVTTIGDSAFWDYWNLTSVTIPDSVKFIGANPFVGILSEKEIIISPEHPVLAVEGGALFNKQTGMLISHFLPLETSVYEVPQGTTSIGAGAFTYREDIASILLPDSLVSIGDNAFQFSSLEDIILPDSVTSIGNQAFMGCDKLKSVTLSNSLETIGSKAFYDCYNLSSLSLPASLTFIDKYAFTDMYMKLIVPANSFAEVYAELNHYPYTIE